MKSSEEEWKLQTYDVIWILEMHILDVLDEELYYVNKDYGFHSKSYGVSS
jgi:hypothetical protein